MVLQPHSELGQDVIPQGVAELQDLGDWAQRGRLRSSWDPQDPRVPGPPEGAEPLDPTRCHPSLGPTPRTALTALS